MNEGQEHTDGIEQTSPDIEAQREVLRAIVEGIDSETARMGFKRRFQGCLGDLISNPMWDDWTPRSESDGDEIIEMLRDRFVCADARQSNLNLEKIWVTKQRYRPTMRAPIRRSIGRR